LSQTKPSTPAQIPEPHRRELAKSLGTPIDPDSPHDRELRIIANAWPSQKYSIPEARLHAKQRSRMSKINTALSKLEKALEELEFEDQLLIISEASNQDLGLDKLDVSILKSPVSVWAPVFDVLANRKLRQGKSSNELLVRFCQWLAIVYREISGLKPTYTDMKKAINTGEPQSKFGMFVVAFFGWVEPEMDPSKLKELLKKAAWQGYQKRDNEL
jgi:hypothetical protein